MDWIPHTRIQGLTQKVIQTVTPLNTVANQVLYSLPSYLFNNAKDALDLIFKRSFKYTVLESVMSSGDIISPVEGAYYIIGSPKKYYQYVSGNFVELEPVKEYDVINITANNNGMSYVQGGNFHAVPCIQIKQYPLTGNDANDAEALIYDDDLQEIVFRSPLTVKIADIVTITNNVDFMGNPRTQLSIVGDYTFLIHAGDSILLRYLNQNIYEVLDCSFDSVNTNIIINANGLDTSPPLGEIWGQRDIPYKTSQLVNDSSYTELSTLSLYVQEANLDSEVGALGYIKTFTETDPIFTSSQAFNIDATDITNLGNLSGVNTGDETNSSIKTKLGAANTSTDGYLTSTDWNTFNNKQNALGFTPENVANKENAALDTSSTKYPTNNLVKTYTDSLNSIQTAKFTAMQEPSGFPCNPSTGEVDRTTTAISFNNSSRTFTITPTGASFDVYINGTKFNYTTAQNVTITDTEGLWYFYFDNSGVLAATQSFVMDIIYSLGYCGIVYWDADNNIALLGVQDERHGCKMDGHTHAYIHSRFATKYNSGAGLNSIVANGNGSSDTHAQFGVDVGSFNDEDIPFSAPAVLSTTGLPILHKSGAAGNWRKSTNAGFSVLTTGTGRLAYNQFTGGAWQLTEVPNTNYVNYHIIFTSGLDASTGQYYAIIGQQQYSTLTAARSGATSEAASLIQTGLPLHEYKFIATVIFQTSNSYGNTVKARIRTTDTGANYVDLRNESISSTSITGFVETDPIFSASAAASITATDITHLSNLSGTNTGDQNLSGYQTIAGLDTAVSGLGYIKTLSGHNVSELTNDSGYITASALSGYVPTSRTLTINGTGYDLSADRSWTISAGAVAWGSVTGTLSDQTDLNAALSGKQAALVSGTNIKTINSNSILGSGDLTVSGGDTTTSEGALINSATDKATPVDGDYVGLMDSAASNILKKLSWSNIKATLKTYFDTLYAPLTFKYSDYTLSSNQTTNLANGNHVEFNTTSGSLGGLATGSGQANGIITLAANKSYKVQFYGVLRFSGSTGVVYPQLYNRTASSFIGKSTNNYPMNSTVPENNNCFISEIVTVGGSSIDIEVRIVSPTALTIIYNSATKLTIEEYKGV